jgi:HlyD family secretion protein
MHCSQEEPIWNQGQHSHHWSAFVIENGLAKLPEVEIGRRADFEVEVLNGLREGESVIAHPSNLVAEGVRVSADKK